MMGRIVGRNGRTSPCPMRISPMTASPFCTMCPGPSRRKRLLLSRRSLRLRQDHAVQSMARFWDGGSQAACASADGMCGVQLRQPHPQFLLLVFSGSIRSPTPSPTISRSSRQAQRLHGGGAGRREKSPLLRLYHGIAGNGFDTVIGEGGATLSAASASAFPSPGQL